MTTTTPGPAGAHPAGIADTPEALTPAWLTEVLTTGGHLDGAAVAAVDLRPLGTGQMCDSLRLAVTYDGPTEAPATLVAKLPAADPTSRATAVNLRSYEKEVRFYQELAGELPVPTPTVFHADIEPESAAFVLLLEDLAPAEQGDQLDGCSLGTARSAVDAMALLHAPRWDDAGLRDRDWLHTDDETGRAFLAALLPSLWAGFQERYAADLGPHVAPVGEAFFAHLDAYLTPTGGPLTLVHGDFRLDNLLLEPGTGAVRGVVDWQTCAVGPALRDVAYFLGAGLLPDERRAAEEELVHRYHDGLTAAGVADYPWERCWEDHRRGTFAGLLMAVAASMLVARTDRGDEMFLAMASRHARHVLDLDALELLAP